MKEPKQCLLRKIFHLPAAIHAIREMGGGGGGRLGGGGGRLLGGGGGPGGGGKEGFIAGPLRGCFGQNKSPSVRNGRAFGNKVLALFYFPT